MREAVTSELVKLSTALPIGAPWLPENEVGPVVSEKQFQRVMEFIDFSKERGSKPSYRWRPTKKSGASAGLFIAPTIFDNVTPQMRIGHEEIFGPVMSILSWDSYDDMIKWPMELNMV